MPMKITTTEIRTSTEIDWCRTAIFGSEYKVFKHKNNPDVLEIHEDISDDGLTRTHILIVNDDWDIHNGIIDEELVKKFRELKAEYYLKNNITISSVHEQLD
jgi:hypothetical protein